MSEDRDNVVRFRARPKPPPPPRPRPAAHRPGERAINWSKAPKALVVTLIFFVAMWVLSGMAGWISGLGVR